MMHPQTAQRLIREGVKRGVQRRSEIKPFRLAAPVKLEITFKQTVNAEVVSYLPCVERPTGDTVAFTGARHERSNEIPECNCNDEFFLKRGRGRFAGIKSACLWARILSEVGVFCQLTHSSRLVTGKTTSARGKWRRGCPRNEGISISRASWQKEVARQPRCLPQRPSQRLASSTPLLPRTYDMTFTASCL